ncbi:MAG TPA: STAS domain-containing protein [Ilumatobacteraceae bacterium]|nr:STAS domain-containing protein [Ilumatobacteraceae bacterium]
MTRSCSKPTRSPSSPVVLRPLLRIDVRSHRDRRVVRVAGELDLATCDQLVGATTAGHHPAMIVDLGGVTFMDCSGYGALVAARQVIESDGRSLAITGRTGQPARLWSLIADHVDGDRNPV